MLPGRCCRCAYSQNPRLSRGLEESLEGHITDNAPQGASNGSANCIADSWQVPYGAFYLCLGILATRKRVNKLFQAHLIRYLIFVKLMLDVLRNLLLISPYCVNIVSPCPEVPISILVFQVRVSVEYILPSEKAKAYEMKLEATRRKAGIPLKINSGQVDQNFSQPYSVEKVADEAGESVKQVQRFIRLNKLTPDLMQLVDDGRLKTTPVVELSYLTPEEQEDFFSYMEEEGCTPSLSQAQKLKASSEESVLTKDKIHPFNDGNGRMSRLLTTLLLYRSGFYVGRYISLEAIIAKHKDLYYEALQQSQNGWHNGTEDVVLFIKYILGTILYAYKEFEKRFSIVEEKLPAVDMVRKAANGKIGRFNKQDIMELCPTLSISAVEGALRKLVAAGELKREGAGKSTYYIRLQ